MNLQLTQQISRLWSVNGLISRKLGSWGGFSRYRHLELALGQLHLHDGGATARPRARLVRELSVTAVALVRPDQSVHSVEVASVLKKFKHKGFAAKVNRDDIVRGAAELAMSLEELIRHIIMALRAEAGALGLGGATTETA